MRERNTRYAEEDSRARQRVAGAEFPLTHAPQDQARQHDHDRERVADPDGSERAIDI